MAESHLTTIKYKFCGPEEYLGNVDGIFGTFAILPVNL
jgi:hypothetical protein